MCVYIYIYIYIYMFIYVYMYIYNVILTDCYNRCNRFVETARNENEAASCVKRKEANMKRTLFMQRIRRKEHFSLLIPGYKE